MEENIHNSSNDTQYFETAIQKTGGSRSITITRYNGTQTEVVIPDAIDGLPVTAIGERVFSYNKLTGIKLPDRLSVIGRGAFDGCGKLARFTVDKENPVYRDIDGVLFDKTGTTLVRYPMGMKDRVYTVPDSISHIGDGAFEESSYRLSSAIVINELLDILNEENELTAIILPDSLTHIGEGAFGDLLGSPI